jgi:hypothetical protein
MKKLGLVLCLLSTILTLGCDDSEDTDTETATGDLTVELWGEAFIETGIPATEFADGYAIVFDQFLIALDGITVAKSPGATPVATFAPQRIWDLTQPGPVVVGTAPVTIGAYKSTGYAIRKTTAAATSGNATQADVAFMKQNQYSVYAAGTASKDGQAWSFAYGFSTDTIYESCNSGGVVSKNVGGSIQLTIHGDHFFYDSAVSESPALRFHDMVLADAGANNDLSILADDLVQYPLLPLTHYRVPDDSGIDNMWTYLAHMTRTLGHIDGEGHCESR